jgi:preprotein translocase subunit YajC
MGPLVQFAASSSGSGFPAGFIFLPAMFLLIYFVMLRPQQRRAKAQVALQRQVGVGDEILTTSGMYGIVTAMDTDDVWLEIAENTEIRIARGAVMRVTQSVNSDDVTSSELGTEPTEDE